MITSDEKDRIKSMLFLPFSIPFINTLPCTYQTGPSFSSLQPVPQSTENVTTLSALEIAEQMTYLDQRILFAVHSRSVAT